MAILVSRRAGDGGRGAQPACSSRWMVTDPAQRKAPNSGAPTA